jgi:hypothetical protein
VKNHQFRAFQMKKNLIALVLISIFVSPVMATKPEFAGEGKPTEAQKAAHKTAMEAKEGLEEDDDDDDRIKDKKDGELTGVEKQEVNKSEQFQNELDKGSDKGKESREANSKKWWKFWGE